eukprot:CAMPEP_0197437326 /NCGR_PEP_ID=MMETSP1175-20131217/4595_1 /TAXON_ID=1003142 /ORGANISM="Triceratium dubium, Strain CCMP147" /LENGTH=55 /DNA_ID=CAMNT_0042966821 /DNA_START=47 /DNA_END=214 /DNA_ORIENTATION=+
MNTGDEARQGHAFVTAVALAFLCLVIGGFACLRCVSAERRRREGYGIAATEEEDE